MVLDCLDSLDSLDQPKLGDKIKKLLPFFSGGCRRFWLGVLFGQFNPNWRLTMALMDLVKEAFEGNGLGWEELPPLPKIDKKELLKQFACLYMVDRQVQKETLQETMGYCEGLCNAYEGGSNDGIIDLLNVVISELRTNKDGVNRYHHAFLLTKLNGESGFVPELAWMAAVARMLYYNMFGGPVLKSQGDLEVEENPNVGTEKEVVLPPELTPLEEEDVKSEPVRGKQKISAKRLVKKV